MTIGTQSHPRPDAEQGPTESVHGSSPFLEPENTDGWIASDVIVDVTRWE